MDLPESHLTIAARVAQVRDRIAAAAARSGRSIEAVTLVAVSKTHPGSAVEEAFAAGLRHFGENKVQEAETKVPALASLRAQGLRWHLIGHLQTNKARKAVELFDRLHGVDDVRLGQRLEKAAEEQHKLLPMLVQVDLAGEETKFGVPVEQLFGTLDALRSCKAVRTDGLMLMPPYDADPERVRPLFRRLRELRDEALAQNLLRGRELSMGMSHDFEVAIEEGATLVRVGTALFGERARRAT
jgi:PLP dependent protein